MQLIKQSRKINMILKRTNGKSVNFSEMTERLCDVITANFFIISDKGKLLGFAIHQEIDNERMKKMLEERQFPDEYTEGLFSIHKTTSNLDINSEYTVFPIENSKLFQHSLTTIVPIIGGGERLGTLILGRLNQEFADDDLLLAEYGSTVVGMEILQERTSEIETEARSKAVVQMAISSLSYSE